MDMLSILADAADGSNVAYHDFLLFYRPTELLVYGFVEGKQDPSYYRSAIDNRLPGGWRCKLIPAGSKTKVLELLAAMDWSRFPRKAVCFFVDRDLSNFLVGQQYSADNLYVSDCYSIENDIISLYTFERLLEEVYGVSGLWPNEWNRVYAMFESNLRVFTEALSCIMAYLIVLRRDEAQSDSNVVIARFDKIKPHAFFEFEKGVLRLKSAFATADSRVGYACSTMGVTAPEPERLKKAECEFLAADGPTKFVRGKYLLRFFTDCADSIREAVPAFSPRFSAPPGIRPALGAAQTIAIIAPRIKPPDSLILFIEKNYMEYIESGAFSPQQENA